MTTPHLADTAKPGDAFLDEGGHTWLKIGFATIHSWVVAGPGAALSMTNADARKHTLTPLTPAPSTIQRSSATQLRYAAAVCDAAGVPTAVTSVGAWLRARADRFDVEDADYVAAIEVAEDLSFYGSLNTNGQAMLIDALVESRRAGRTAAKAGA